MQVLPFYLSFQSSSIVNTTKKNFEKLLSFHAHFLKLDFSHPSLFFKEKKAFSNFCSKYKVRKHEALPREIHSSAADKLGKSGSVANV